MRDEVARNQVLPEQLATLRDSSALRLAYCLLISMQHLSKRARLEPTTQNVDHSGELNREFLSQGGTLNFRNI